MRTTRYSEPSDAEFDRAMEHTLVAEEEETQDDEDEEGDEHRALPRRERERLTLSPTTPPLPKLGAAILFDIMSMTQDQINVSLFDEVKKLQRENARLKEREKLCETMDQAEKLALIRALQEIRDEVGLFGDGVSPRQIVDAVKSRLSNEKGQR